MSPLRRKAEYYKAECDKKLNVKKKLKIECQKVEDQKVEYFMKIKNTMSNMKIDFWRKPRMI